MKSGEEYICPECENTFVGRDYCPDCNCELEEQGTGIKVTDIEEDEGDI